MNDDPARCDLLPPAGGHSRADHRTRLRHPFRAADCRDALRPGDGRGGEPGDGEALSRRAHTRCHGGTGSGAAQGLHQDHRPVQHQGREHPEDLPHSPRRARRRGAPAARGAGSAARRRPQDRQRGAEHGLRRADHRRGHAYLSRVQPHGYRPRRDAPQGGGRGPQHGRVRARPVAQPLLALPQRVRRPAGAVQPGGGLRPAHRHPHVEVPRRMEPAAGSLEHPDVRPDVEHQLHHRPEQPAADPADPTT